MSVAVFGSGSFRAFSQSLLLFPVALTCSVVLTVILVSDTFGLFQFNDELENNAKIGFTAAFLASGAVNLHLHATQRFPTILNHLLALLAVIAMVWLGFFNQAAMANPVFLFPGLILLVMIAPYLLRTSTEESVWLYNARLLLAVVLSTVAGLTFGGGLNAIATSIDFLFDIEVKREFHTAIWYISFFFVGPVFGLSMTPTSFDDALKLPQPASLAGRGISVILNYVLTPLLIIYLIVLHLYAAKTLAAWTLPKGQIGWMVISFSIAITAAVLTGRPWRDRCTRVTRWLLDYWHYLLATPLILLGIGVTRRLVDYGVTPERYGLVLIGIWVVFLLASPIVLRKQIRNVQIICTLALLLIGTSFGPWGSVGISVQSQVSRLHDLLDTKGWIKDGKLAADFQTPRYIKKSDARTGVSILRLLETHHSLGKIEPLFQSYPNNPFENDVSYTPDAHQINVLLGFSKPSPYLSRSSRNKNWTRIRWEAELSASLPISAPGLLVGPFRLNFASTEHSERTRQDNVHAWYENGKLFIETAETSRVIDLKEIAVSVSKAGKPENKSHRLIHTTKTPEGEVKLIISQLLFHEDDNGALYPDTLRFWAVIENK